MESYIPVENECSDNISQALMIMYDLIGYREQLSALKKAIVEYLYQKDIHVIYGKPVTKKYVKNVYRNGRAMNELNARNGKYDIPCVSDGKYVYIGETNENSSLLSIFDLLHVGCGHIWQWNTVEANILKFHGDYAWEIGSSAYVSLGEEDKKKLSDIKEYEEEAGAISILNLQHILDNSVYFSNIGGGNKFISNFKLFYGDFLKADLKSLLHFGKKGEARNIFELLNEVKNEKNEKNINNLFEYIDINIKFSPIPRKNVQEVFR